MAESVRTFIAIELPPEAREYLALQQADLERAGGNVCWVAPDRIHLTLVFLGDVLAARLGSLEQAVRGACAGSGPMTLRMGGAGQFPPRGQPRVIWCGVEEAGGALQRLQKRLAEATAPFAEEVEDRAYSPHLTLGRVRGGDTRRLSEAVAAMAGAAGPEFKAREVLIIKSQLSSEGPTYTVLARAALAEGGS